MRGEPGDAAGESVRDGDGAQPVRDAARADRLLTEHAFVEGDPFVGGTAFEAADADGGEDEVGAPQCLVELGGGQNGGCVRHPLGLIGEDAGDGGEPVGVGVVEGDGSDAAFGMVGEQRPVHQGDPESAAAQNCQLHASAWYGPEAPYRVRRHHRGKRAGRWSRTPRSGTTGP